MHTSFPRLFFYILTIDVVACPFHFFRPFTTLILDGYGFVGAVLLVYPLVKKAFVGLRAYRQHLPQHEMKDQRLRQNNKYCEIRQQHSLCDKGLEDLSQASVISLQHFDNMLSLGARHADTTFETPSWAFTANKPPSHSCPLMSAKLVYTLIEGGQCNSTCSSSSTAGLQALHTLTCSACTLSFSYLASESAAYGSKAWSC